MRDYLHVLNGSCAQEVLEGTGLPGEMVVWADVLHDGPVPGGLADEALLRIRAGHLAGALDEPEVRAQEEFLAALRAANSRMARVEHFEEVVIWLEHDLFDQLLLIRHLAWASRLDDASRLRLICIGGFAGHPRFAGLGELNPSEMASLWPLRAPITADQLALGRRLWEAFVAPDPRVFADLVLRGDTRALPFAKGALTRFLEDYPAVGSGLSRSERQILSVVREGHGDPVAAFRAAAAREERVFMGDLTFFRVVDGMTAGRTPLLSFAGERGRRVPWSGELTLTEAGRAALDGRADYLDLNGIDRWMGGVHLTDGRYRWSGSDLTTDIR